jgi:hypothetical protein
MTVSEVGGRDVGLAPALAMPPEVNNNQLDKAGDHLD